LIACPAAGEEPTDPPPSEVLEAGDPAPFAGILLPTETAIRLELRLEFADERKAAELTRQTRTFEIKLQAEKDRNAARLDAANERAKLLLKELDRALAWYRSPAFVAAVTGALSLVVVGVVGYAFGELARSGTLVVNSP
jgi:hypothetical protein